MVMARLLSRNQSGDVCALDSGENDVRADVVVVHLYGIGLHGGLLRGGCPRCARPPLAIHRGQGGRPRPDRQNVGGLFGGGLSVR